MKYSSLNYFSPKWNVSLYSMPHFMLLTTAFGKLKKNLLSLFALHK